MSNTVHRLENLEYSFCRQSMYHSISLVGTLLLQIGEVGQKVKDAQAQQMLMRSKSIDREEVTKDVSEDITAPPVSYSSYDLANVVKETTETTENANPEWSVTFDQFVANVMNESCLVDFFDRKIDVVTKLKQFGDIKMKRQSSVPMTGSQSVFYA